MKNEGKYKRFVDRKPSEVYNGSAQLFAHAPAPARPTMHTEAVRGCIYIVYPPKYLDLNVHPPGYQLTHNGYPKQAWIYKCAPPRLYSMCSV